MKLARLLDENLHLALKELKTQKLPAKTAFQLKGIQKRIEEELVKYEEVRKELLNRCGKKDDNGILLMDENNNVTLEGEGQAEFIREFNELVNTDVDVGTFSLSALGDKVELSGDDVINLDGILVE